MRKQAKPKHQGQPKPPARPETTAPVKNELKPPTKEEPKPFGKYDEWMRLFAAFALTGILGAFISMYVQERSWRHQHTLTVCDDDKKSAMEVANKVSDAMDH